MAKNMGTQKATLGGLANSTILNILKPASNSGTSTAKATPVAKAAPKTSGINTTAYDNLYKNYAASVDADAAQKIQQAQKQADTQLKQAYLTRVQNERSLSDNLARAGIRGGATETSNLRLANQYGSSVGQINSNLADTTNQINTTASQNKLAYRQDIDAKRQQYIEDREREARQTAREDKQIAYERSQTKRQQNLDYYTAWASKFKDPKKLKKELKAAKKAKNTLKVQVINARLGFLADNK